MNTSKSSRQTSNDENNNDFVLQEFIALISQNFEPTVYYESNLTLTMTTEELIEKVKIASGENFNAQDIKEAMQKQGFSLCFITADQIANYYWLLNPKI